MKKQEAEMKETLDSVVLDIQTAGVGTPPGAGMESSKETEDKLTQVDKSKGKPSESKSKAEKTWQRLLPGEVPKKGERISCVDGEGVAESNTGVNVMVKLDNGYKWYGGIDRVRVLR